MIFCPKRGDQYGIQDSYEAQLLQVMNELTTDYYRNDPDAETSYESQLGNLHALLREYLELVSKDCTIEPEQSFKKDMLKCGLWNNHTNIRKNASGVATGSPRKDN